MSIMPRSTCQACLGSRGCSGAQRRSRMGRGFWPPIGAHVRLCGAMPRMLVLLRTFNRTRDVLNLLRTFLAESQRTGSARYQHMLKNTFFLILDTSATDLEEEYAPLAELDGLNFYAVKGNNLGGGGNMSQVMRLTAEACSAAGRKPDELLLLDDDLNLSLESLYRHWAMSAMRTDDTILTLPVMTKSDPRKMWEDGAFWGRMVGERPQNLRDQLAPRLLRHNLFFEGPDHLDALAVRNYPEYCTFIFFSLPYRLFETLGYPLAIFLRGDDIEYSLRAKKIAGVRVFSNPNLLAWHEPGHSFGQEYMSVMHGILINFTYGDAKPDAPVQFFLNRAAAHLSISDRQGLAVYAAVLEDICAKKDLLDHGFVQTYLSRLKEFKGFEASYEDLPQEVIDSVRRAQGGTSRGLYEAPFLYMTGRTERDVETACLYNPHSKEHRIYSVSQVETLLDAAKEATRLTGLIQSFAANFQELRAHYAMKSVDCQKAAFWDVELARYADPSPIAKSGG
jgi:GT2 family glycosyltransferase